MVIIDSCFTPTYVRHLQQACRHAIDGSMTEVVSVMLCIHDVIVGATGCADDRLVYTLCDICNGELGMVSQFVLRVTKAYQWSWPIRSCPQ
jgi:hypothetical protein